MESDGDKQNKKTKRKRKEVNFLQRYLFNVSNVFSSFWIRRPIQIDYGHEWIILDSRYNFLFYFRLFLYFVYVTYEINK